MLVAASAALGRGVSCESLVMQACKRNHRRWPWLEQAHSCNTSTPAIDVLMQPAQLLPTCGAQPAHGFTRLFLGGAGSSIRCCSRVLLMVARGEVMGRFNWLRTPSQHRCMQGAPAGERRAATTSHAWAALRVRLRCR